MKGDLVKGTLKLGLIAIIILVLYRYGGELQDRIDIDQIQAFVESFGIVGIVVFILLGTIRPFFFLPNVLMFVIGGLLYGTLLGGLASLIGLLLASSLCYLLANKFTGPFSKLVGKRYVEKLEKIKNRDSIKALFMMRVTPGFPVDPVSYGAGLTGINYYDFFIGTLLGSAPKVFLYTFLGDGIEEIMSIRTIVVFIVLFLLALLPVVFKKKGTVI